MFNKPSKRISCLPLKAALLVLCLCPLRAGARDGASSMSWEQIQASPEYISAIGQGITVSRAEANAKSLLLGNLRNNLTGHGEFRDIDLSTTAFSDYDQLVGAIAVSYAPEIDRIVGKINMPDGRVMVYLHSTEGLVELFMSRWDKLARHIADGYAAEKAGKIDFALRDYYWAMMLMKTIPSTLTGDFPVALEPDGETVDPATWLPQHLSSLFSSLSVEVASREGHDVELSFKLGGQPVTSLEYTYFDAGEKRHFKAKDGFGPLTLNPSSSECQIGYEYEFFEEVRSHKEIDETLNIFRRVSFPESVVTLSMRKDGLAVSKSAGKEFRNMGKEASKTSIASLSEAESAPYREVIGRILSAIRSRSYSGVEDCFTDFGLDCWNKLVSYGSARIVGEPSPKYYAMGADRVVCRSVPMTFSFRNGSKTFNEDVTFTFSSESGKIEALAFSLGKEADRTVFRNEVWDDYSKMVVVNFLENYKTAYSLKRLDYLEAIFDENAYILVGHMVSRDNKATPSDGGAALGGGQDAVYQKLTKDEYIRNLRTSFASKDYINIAFADNRVSKMGRGGDTYGITLKQEYSSSNYADKGYLILMVDLNDRDHPRITVRVWQSERDGNMTYGLDKSDPDYGLFDLNNLY